MPMILSLVRAFVRSFSVPGLILATLFFAASLTPSLVPRAPVVQGVVSGFSLAAGYGIGVALLWLWRYLALPAGRVPRMVWTGLSVICAGTAFWYLWRASAWQNSIRDLMGMDPVPGGRPWFVGAVAVVSFLVILLIARAFGLVVRVAARWLAQRISRPVANIIGLLIAVLLFWSITTGVIVERALMVADNVYRQFDLLLEDGVAQPTDPAKTGSAASLVDWQTMGRAGREMIAAGPTAADIAALTGVPAIEPIRVYVGLSNAETPQTRADLALAEMLRVGAFDRSVLVITMPTGTGWIDPESQAPVEYLHRGDIATVSVQYSYLASWLALMVAPTYGSETSRALFDTVYGYWTALPKDARPRLYLHGLSLGSYNSDLSTDLFKVIGDPFDGAFWVGPPFNSRTWPRVVASRNPGTTAWLPDFRDGSLIRFTAQANHLDAATASWGAMRIVYLQYASDAITFFDPASLFRVPDWMVGPRGPDVSPEMTWYPVVTFIQLTVDLMTAVATPIGHGHVYAAEHYIDGWVAVTEPPGWTPEGLDRLKAYFIDARAD